MPDLLGPLQLHETTHPHGNGHAPGREIARLKVMATHQLLAQPRAAFFERQVGYASRHTEPIEVWITNGGLRSGMSHRFFIASLLGGRWDSRSQGESNSPASRSGDFSRPATQIRKHGPVVRVDTAPYFLHRPTVLVRNGEGPGRGTRVIACPESNHKGDYPSSSRRTGSLASRPA